MTDRIAAVVLAGGRSSRFGRDKLAERVDGVPLLERAVAALAGIADDIVIVVAPGTTSLAPWAGGTIRVVHDANAFEGPLVGLATGLSAVDAEIVLVVGGDMPSLVPDVLRRLVASVAGSDGDLAVLDDAGRPRPLPMAVRRAAALTAADRLVRGGERRLRALLHDLPTITIGETVWRREDPDGRTLRDIDVPADLLDRGHG